MSRHKDVSTVLSRAPLGLAAPLVRVKVHLGSGLPTFAMVGLPEAVVRESKERVRSALVTSGFEFPTGRITVNLSPAELPKEGGRFDLPIAVGILAAAGEIPRPALERREFYGELSLGGELRQTPKLLPALIAGARSGRELILPFANGLEASLLRHAKLKLASDLRQVCAALRGAATLPPAASAGNIADARDPSSADRPADLAEVRGQFTAKRALEIAAGGEHGLFNLWTTGPAFRLVRASQSSFRNASSSLARSPGSGSNDMSNWRPMSGASSTLASRRSSSYSASWAILSPGRSEMGISPKLASSNVITPRYLGLIIDALAIFNPSRAHDERAVTMPCRVGGITIHSKVGTRASDPGCSKSDLPNGTSILWCFCFSSCTR